MMLPCESTGGGMNFCDDRPGLVIANKARAIHKRTEYGFSP